MSLTLAGSLSHVLQALLRMEFRVLEGTIRTIGTIGIHWVHQLFLCYVSSHELMYFSQLQEKCIIILLITEEKTDPQRSP